MFAWMKEHKLALIVSTLMFALMAGIMGEFVMVDDSVFDAIFGDGGVSTFGMLWTWRIGGFVTWPVFMWLLLRPHANMQVDEHRKCLGITLVVAALYGGGGLWLVSEILRGVMLLDESVLVFVTPFLAIATLGLPYLYTWGFVAIYGSARTRLANVSTKGWVSKSLLATVLGIYGVGALVYLAFGIVVLPIAVIVSILPEEISSHVLVDLCAIALSTGNFASQWYAFYKVDEFLNAPAEMPGATTYGAPVPGGVGAYPAQQPSAVPAQPVILADGRLVTPDGRVYVAQDAMQAGPQQAVAAPGVAQPYYPASQPVGGYPPAAAAQAAPQGYVAQPQGMVPYQPATQQPSPYPPQAPYAQEAQPYPVYQQPQPMQPTAQVAYQQQMMPQAPAASAYQVPVQPQAAPYQQAPAAPSAPAQPQQPPATPGDDLPYSYDQKNG